MTWAKLLFLLIVVPPAVAEEWTLCARVGPLQVTSGQAIAFGSYVVPPVWSVRRDVRYQVCTAGGRAVARRVHVELAVQPLDTAPAETRLESSSVITDEQGRFSAVYGAGRRNEGPAWPDGVVSRELHQFRIDGRPGATFLIEREAGDIRVARLGN